MQPDHVPGYTQTEKPTPVRHRLVAVLPEKEKSIGRGSVAHI